LSTSAGCADIVIADLLSCWCISEDSNLDPDRYERPALPVELEMRDVAETGDLHGNLTRLNP
jgi:hypothetical protein